MIHRDIKPGNLILDNTGKTWVTDFGLATESCETADGTESCAGTPRYMAPEQFEGFADERTDVYSLGLTLYELATGVPVFDNIPRKQLANRKTKPLDSVTDLNPEIPKALADIIMRACSVAPGDRYPNSQELQVVLNRYAHSGLEGDRRSRPRNTSSTKNTLRPIALLGGGLVLSLAVIITALTTGEVPVEDGQVRWFVSNDASRQQPVPNNLQVSPEDDTP